MDLKTVLLAALLSCLLSSCIKTGLDEGTLVDDSITFYVNCAGPDHCKGDFPQPANGKPTLTFLAFDNCSDWDGSSSGLMAINYGKLICDASLCSFHAEGNNWINPYSTDGIEVDNTQIASVSIFIDINSNSIIDSGEPYLCADLDVEHGNAEYSITITNVKD